MQHRKTISLSDRDDEFIAMQLSHGEFNNVSEVVRAGLRLLEQEHLKLKALRQAIAKGDAEIEAGLGRELKPGELGRSVRSVLAKTSKNR